jgi:hypothetical protein
MLNDLKLAETSSNGGKQLKLQLKKSSKLQIKRLRDKGKLFFFHFYVSLKLIFFWFLSWIGKSSDPELDRSHHLKTGRKRVDFDPSYSPKRVFTENLQLDRHFFRISGGD